MSDSAKMTLRRVVPLVLALAGASLGGASVSCSNYRESGGAESPSAYLTSEASSAVSAFRAADPTLGKFFDQAYAYVVFPKIVKGAAGIGAANGEGVVYRGGLAAENVIGYATVTQVTLGAQLGGQSYRQLMFLQDAATLGAFKAGQTEFAANASAVISKSGSAAASDYAQGVAVFVMPIEGVMAEAAIGGQRFRFRPAP